MLSMEEAKLNRQLISLHGIPDQSEKCSDWKRVSIISLAMHNFSTTHPNYADFLQVLQFLVVPERHDTFHECMVPRIQLDTGRL